MDFYPQVENRTLHPSYLMCQRFQKRLIYYTSPESTKLFHPREGINVVSTIKIRMNLCFSVAKNVVPVEDIIEMHNVENKITKAEIYNASICCHCIVWYLKICLEYLNEVKNVFTWMIFLLNPSLLRETDNVQTQSPSSVRRKWNTDGQRQTGQIGSHCIGRDNIGLIVTQLL